MSKNYIEDRLNQAKKFLNLVDLIQQYSKLKGVTDAMLSEMFKYIVLSFLATQVITVALYFYSTATVVDCSLLMGITFLTGIYISICVGFNRLINLHQSLTDDTDKKN